VAVSGRKNADAALVLALAGGKTVEAAAGEAGVSERTAYRRLEDPEFRRRVTEARATMVERALGKTADGMADAADTLRRLLTAGSGPVQLGAARSLLELGVKLRESVELEERIAALEDAIPDPPPLRETRGGTP
jgi:hypothetical protein